jgi:hypothetical protein
MVVDRSLLSINDIISRATCSVHRAGSAQVELVTDTTACALLQ